MNIAGGIGMYLLKVLAGLLSWLLQKSLSSIVVAMLLTGMAIGALVCLPLVLLALLHKKYKR